MKVFSYGTLQQKFSTQPREQAIFKSYYRVDTSDMFPRIVKTDELNTIAGTVIEFSDEEFIEVDAYEGYPDLYQRIEALVELDSGEKIQAWIYF